MSIPNCTADAMSESESQREEYERFCRLMADGDFPENQLGMPEFSSDPGNHIIFPPLYASSESSEEETVDPEIYSSDDSTTLCHFSDIQQIIASKSNYNGGRFSKYLEDQFGCICIPLWAVSKLRLPKGDHKADPPAIVFIPPKGPDHAVYENFSSAAETFFNIAHSNNE